MTNTIRGVNIALYPLKASGQPIILDDIKRAYDDLQEVGGQAVALNPVQYVSCIEGTVTPTRPPASYRTKRLIWPDVGQGLHPWAQTIDANLLLLAALEAKARGLTVMLKPMVDWERGGWRGFLSPSNRYNWAKAHHQMLRPYIEIAREAHVDAFCVGTEMYQTTKDVGGQFWADMAEYAFNQGYRGLFTYASNWGWGTDAEYERITHTQWAAFHRVGVDAYFPLLEQGVPITEQTVYDGWHRRGIETEWCLPIDEDLTTLCDGDLSELWFTEIGYRADSNAALDPGADPSNGIYSPEAQIACWRAFRRKWDGKIGAYFAWDWRLDMSNVHLRSHNLRGRTEAARAALGDGA